MLSLRLRSRKIVTAVGIRFKGGFQMVERTRRGRYNCQSLNTRFTRLPDSRLSLVSRFLCASTREHTQRHTHDSRDFQIADCPASRFACFHTPAHTQTHALTPQYARALLFYPRSPLRAAPPTIPPVQLSSSPFPLSYTPR